jgi:hypothetical protein
MAIQTNRMAPPDTGVRVVQDPWVLKPSPGGVGLGMPRTHRKCYDADRLSADLLLREEPDEDDEDDPKKEDDDDENENENDDGYSE